MSQTLAIQELAIVVAVKKYEPTLLNANLLSASGVIPSEWELTRQPVVTNRLAQISFKNGVNIMAEANRFMFIEATGTKAPEAVECPAAAERYVGSLPNMDYQGVGLNFRGCYFVDGAAAEAKEYVVKNLLVPGSWQSVGVAPIQVGLNVAYTLEGRRLNLNVAEAQVQRPEQAEKSPVILFSGNFDYGVGTLAGAERLTRIKQVILNWNADLQVFRDIVAKFPAPTSVQEMVIPPIT